MEARIKDAVARCVTVAHTGGHEFDFEALPMSAGASPRLFAERWRNRRLPLNADRCREAARHVAVQRFRERGLL